MMPSALEVRNLTVTVPLRTGGRAKVVDDVSFSIRPGGTQALVGESGSGKTMTCLAILGLLPRAARVDSGQILLDGEDLVRATRRRLEQVRGAQVAMVLQDPMTALDPSFTVRSQLSEPLRQHRHLRGSALHSAMVASLEQVHLSAATERLDQYPHQLSGGMRQRVTSAIALAGQPRVLIADEPTTALDVTTQARYLRLLAELQRSTGFALLLVTHDLLVVRQVCERVVVMYAGQVVESGTVTEVFASAKHPYSRALIEAVPVFGETVSLQSIEGQAPDIADEIAGCRFAARCHFARGVCGTSPPSLSARGTDGRTARCWGTEDDGWISG